jgi:hypothetical protein
MLSRKKDTDPDRNQKATPLCDIRRGHCRRKDVLHMYIKRPVRETRAAGIAISAEQLARRAKRNIEEFPGLALDPSPDDRIDRRANGQTGEKEKDRSPDEGPPKITAMVARAPFKTPSCCQGPATLVT